MGPLKKIPEAAEFLGMSVSTLKKLVKSRQVQFTRPPGTRFVRFSDEDLAAYITAGRQAPEKNRVQAVRRRTNAA